MKIGIVSWNAYPIFRPEVKTVIGGMETRSYLFARALSEADGFDVNFIVADHGQARRRQFGDISVVRYTNVPNRLVRLISEHVVFTGPGRFHLKGWGWGLTWWIPQFVAMRTWQRAAGILSSLRRRAGGPDETPPPLVAPDPFYCRLGLDALCCFGVNDISASVIASAKQSGAKSVLLTASDADLDAKYAPDSSAVNEYGQRADVCHFAITQADSVVVQTPRQLEYLAERFGRSGTVIANPADVDGWLPDRSTPAAPRKPKYVLWIGRAEYFHKRADLMIKLAEMCPDVPFLMILNRSVHVGVFDEVCKRRPGNVKIVEQVPFSQVPGLFAKAAALVSTSSAKYEGFPNTFLQAGCSALPIGTLDADPDRFVEKWDCGVAANGDMRRLADFVETVWRDGDKRAEFGRNSLRYVRENHDLDRQAKLLGQVIRDAHGSGMDNRIGSVRKCAGEKQRGIT